MRVDDYNEISCQTWAESREELADHIRNRYTGYTDTIYTLGDGDDRIAIVGWLPLWPTTWTVFMFATDQFDRISKFATRFACSKGVQALNSANAQRVECYSHAKHRTAHRWLEFIGLRPEAVLKNYGKNNEPFIIYSWSRDPRGDMIWRKRGVVN